MARTIFPSGCPTRMPPAAPKEGMLHRCAVMHKAISILMFKLECQVIDCNPDFQMQGRDYCAASTGTPTPCR